MPLFVSYAKYDLANDNSLEKTQLPNQKYIWVNRMIIINVLAKSGIGKMYSARVLHGLIERIEAEPMKFTMVFLYFG